MKNLVILTGAGISAESGLLTFRDNGGLWCNHRIEDVATPEAFRRSPKLVHEFYNMRRAQLKDVEPNAAHHAIAELAERWPGRFLLVTQNVDDLHERALAEVQKRRNAEMQESRNANDASASLQFCNPAFHFIHMHGELTRVRCEVCEDIFSWHDALDTETPCPSCTRPGYMRPHIVWFGEMPLDMERIYRHLQDCDLFISIGTSGNVYPAAGFVQEVRARGKGRCVELNLEPSQGTSLFHEAIHGPATKIVPEFAQRLLDIT